MQKAGDFVQPLDALADSSSIHLHLMNSFKRKGDLYFFRVLSVAL